MAILVVVAIVAQAPLLLGIAQPVRVLGESAVNGDLVLPAMADAAAVLAKNEWPWWNPYARLGEPFLASGAQPLYPGFWPLLFGGARALPWVLALHSALACALMFRWLRVLPASRFSAFLGAGLWGVGVFYQLQLQRLPEAAACAWLPLVLEGVYGLTRPGRTPAFVVAAATGIAAMFATGAHATPRIGVALAVALGALNLLRLPREDRRPALGSLALTGVGALLLSAPFWLDAWQHAGALERGHAPNGAPVLLGAVAPLHVQPAVLASRGLASEGTDALELALFPGTVILILLVIAFLRPSPGRPRWPWLAIATLGMLAAAQGPWSALLHEHLALDGDIPGCSLVLLQLAVLALACQGLDGFFEAPFRRAGVVLGVGATVLVVGLAGLALLVAQPQTLTTWIAHTIARTDDAALAALADALRSAVAPTAVSLVLLGASLLVWRRLGILRFKMVFAGVCFAEIVYLAWATAPQRTVPPAIEIVGTDDARVLATDAISVARLSRGQAPTRRVNRAGDSVLARTRAFLDDATPGALVVGPRVRGSELVTDGYAPRLASLAQIDVLLGDRVLDMPFAAPPGPEGAPPLVAVPFARMVFEARTAADTNAARADLRNRLDPERSVVLEGNPGAFVPRPSAQAARVAVLEHTPHRVRVRVDAGQGRGYLVLADAWAPGWHATLDGEAVPVWPADVAFRAVAVPEGEHEVELVYTPWAKRFGLPLVGVGVVWLLGCWRRGLRRRAICSS